VPECEALAEKWGEEEISTEYLACLCSLLADISPHLQTLMEASCKRMVGDPFDAETLRGTWSSCPFPIREFIFERGLLKNTSRDVDASLRLGFLWDLVLRNQSSSNFPGLSFLLGLYMRLGRSHTEKMVVLSKLRICPSKTTMDRALPSISRNVEAASPLNSIPVFAFDNHQQQFSMSGGARDLTRSNMAHSVTRSVRYVPLLPPAVSLDEELPPLSMGSFKANKKERAQIRACNQQFFLYASGLHFSPGRELPPELSLGSGLEEIMEENQQAQDQEEGEVEEEEEEEEGEEEEGGESCSAQVVDPALPIEDCVLQKEGNHPGEKEKSPLMPLFSPPDMDEWEVDEKILIPEEADAYLEENAAITFAGKSHLRMMDQLLGKSEDPEMVKSVLYSFLGEMQKFGQSHAFVMCDEKLFTICLSLQPKNRDFTKFTFLLDPFHLGWNLEKVSFPFSLLFP